MDFETFSACARRSFEAIPAEFRRDVTGLVVEERCVDHALIADCWTLGECRRATPLEDETEFRSTVFLYHGSFRALATREAEFDWAGEIWETITHEIRHHLEDRAGLPDLRHLDWAVDEEARRRAGQPFHPRFYRAGEELAPGEFLVEGSLFLEVVVRARELARLGGRLQVTYGGEVFEVQVPPAADPVTWHEIQGGWEDDEGSGGDLFVVVVRK